MVLIIFILLGSFITYELIYKYRIAAVQASSGLTLLVYMILFLFSVENIALYIAALYGGSFIGMSSRKVLKYLDLFVSSLIFYLLFVFLIPLLGGLGGALGISAFLSVFIVRFFAISSFSR